ncbi:GNAT family N-acetyltransferase [Arthrobacter sulfonylureivorans]|uniref:GNAT family N-acetyltransferase n=1 Tax=Arthrobacter sulfonylureivorans TaxID=2486855 RepID=UPI0039E3B512
MTKPPALRGASSADCDQVVEVFLACWRLSYVQVLPAQLIQSMTAERARALWMRALSAEKVDDEVIVAAGAETGTVAGVVRYGLPDSGHGIIWSLYVAPSAQGSGIGSRLLTAAESALRTRGAESASLWVFTANTPSMDFYASHGWLRGMEGPSRSQEFGEPVQRLAKSLVGIPGTRTSVGSGAAPELPTGLLAALAEVVP